MAAWSLGVVAAGCTDENDPKTWVAQLNDQAKQVQAVNRIVQKYEDALTQDKKDRAGPTVKPLLDTLAPPNGWAHFGKSGAGHFTKMVHNGIEYGMMQAYGEGFELLHASEFGLDLRKVAHVWNQGSVVRSWLLELAERAFEVEGSDLAHIRGYVADSGEGRWTIQEAIAHDVPATVLAHSLFARFTSRQQDSYAMKVAAALRNQFGGHEVKTE